MTKGLVKFPLSQPELSGFVDGDHAELVIEHPNYRARAIIPQETGESLIEDLMG
ncbi:MAG TPA: DUF3501 family protein [Candidatus Binatia bacterium]|nr:DUF3501 family protein [Candidatus Binatia bacterium]